MTKRIDSLLNWWVRLKPDLRTKIGLGLLAAGLTLLIGGISGSFSFLYTSGAGETTSLSGNVNDTPWYISVTGFICISFGFLMLLHRYWTLHQESKIKNIALFFMPGFVNMNEELPDYALPAAEKNKVLPTNFTKIDSYDVTAIVTEFANSELMVRRRIDHDKAVKGYVAALGSVPYLYIMGCVFRNGHLPLSVLEHERTIDKWQMLDIFGPEQSVIIEFGQYSAIEAIDNISANEQGEIGLSISFTTDVLKADLPSALKSHTLNIKLENNLGFDAVPTDSVQDEIVKKIAHTLTTIAKKANKVHIFIAAQASIVFKLGKLYQDNMMGKVVIHNFDFKNKRYNWAIEFDGNRPSVYVSNKAEKSGTASLLEH